MTEKDLFKFIEKLKRFETHEQGCGTPLVYYYGSEFKELELIVKIYFILKKGNYFL